MNAVPTEITTRRKPDLLRTVAYALLILALSFWLLDKLAIVLRPLLLAVLIGYCLLPYHNRMRKVLPSTISLGIIVTVCVVVLSVIGFLFYSSIRELESELPTYSKKATELSQRVGIWLSAHAPASLGKGNENQHPEEAAIDAIQGAAKTALNTAASGIIEAATAALYLFFLMLGAGSMPGRVRNAYDEKKAEQILDVFGRINSAIIRYLKAKVVSSIVLAVAAGLILTACGVRFVLVWSILTFLCNFIPYIGSVIAYTVPVGFAAVTGQPGWSWIVAAVLLLVVHVLSATVLEPMILGKAVGLSPLVILAALALWGSIWGFPGMLMAVPLTVVLVIILGNVEATRPYAKLMSGD